MNPDFFRKIGYGLRPDEDIPEDPIQWATAQVEKPAPLLWGGDIPSGDELMDHRAHYVYQSRKVLRKKFKSDRKAYKKAEDQLRYETGERYFPSLEIAIRQYNAVNGEAPFFERLWHFWANHFAISEKDMLDRWNTGAYQREVIRPNMCGNFTDLVKKVTVSWTMIHHLDNERSVGPNSKQGRWLKKDGRVATVNENHARELLELHTVSPAAGYTQEDVVALSYIMAGWGMTYSKKREECNPVKFNPDKHEPGVHHVLGKGYKQKGISSKSKIFDCIEDLCAHPSTRRHISWKLVRHFVTDDPTEEMIAPLVKAWEDTDGDLPSVYKALVQVVYDHTGTHKKFLNPETWFLQCIRISGANWPPTPEMMKYDFKSKPKKWAKRPKSIMHEMGHCILSPQQPNGWPDTMEEWLSPELLIRRLAMARWIVDMREVRPNVDYKTVAYKNFSVAKDLLLVLKKSNYQYEPYGRRVGQNLFASERMMFV